MPGILVDGVKTQILDDKLASPPYDTLEMGLFTGPTIPTHATVFADLTEVTGTGYARQPVAGWSASVLLANFNAYSRAADCVFGPAGAGDWDEATGWFWYDTTLNRLVSVGRFALPFTLGSGESWPFAPSDQFTGG